MPRMRIALIAMPWSPSRLPSPALGALAAFLRKETAHSVVCLHEHVEVDQLLGPLYDPVSTSDRIGELIYAAHLYPATRQSIQDLYVQWASEYDTGVAWMWGEQHPWPKGAHEDHFRHIHDVTSAHVERLAARQALEHDVFGFTTTSSQLFGSLAVACRLKQLNPNARVILGGGGVTGETGASLLELLPFVDHVVQGAGEHHLVNLLNAIEAGNDGRSLGGILARKGEGSDPNDLKGGEDGIDSLDALPVPDFREFHELVEKHQLLKWSIPIEGSRTECPKSHARIAAEMKAQCERHESVTFLFLDGNGIHDESVGLAAAIQGLGKTLNFFHNVDTTIHPYGLLRLWEAGCSAVQMNIDGLSTSYLRRIGRPTSAIHSLQAMRTAYELGLNNSHSTLLTDFPGSSEEEVLETAETIRRFAFTYQPIETRRYRLLAGTAVCQAPERFGVKNIRIADEFARALPNEISRSLKLRWLDYEPDGTPADWTPVRALTDPWRKLHRHLLQYDGVGWFLGARSLYYYDGGTFLKIIDRRAGHRLFILDSLMRDVYLYCMEITTRPQLHSHFRGRCSSAEIDEVVQELLNDDLMFGEGDAVLSLAVAYRADLAAERIRDARSRRASAS